MIRERLLIMRGQQISHNNTVTLKKEAPAYHEEIHHKRFSTEIKTKTRDTILSINCDVQFLCFSSVKYELYRINITCFFVQMTFCLCYMFILCWKSNGADKLLQKLTKIKRTCYNRSKVVILLCHFNQYSLEHLDASFETF